MEWNKEVTERVRGAMRDRARVMACLCGELEKILPLRQGRSRGEEGHHQLRLYPC